MTIKIKQCSAKHSYDIEYWYKDKIGEEFEVRWIIHSYYFVTTERGANYINKEDI